MTLPFVFSPRSDMIKLYICYQNTKTCANDLHPSIPFLNYQCCFSHVHAYPFKEFTHQTLCLFFLVYVHPDPKHMERSEYATKISKPSYALDALVQDDSNSCVFILQCLLILIASTFVVSYSLASSNEGGQPGVVASGGGLEQIL